MHPYDAVFFDLDGTLTASADGIVNAVAYSLDQLGVTNYERAALRAFVGPPLTYSYRLLIGLTDAQTDAAIAHYQVYYRARGILENSVYPGIPALLRSLKAAGVYVGIVTAKPIVHSSRVLREFDLEKYVDVLSGPDGENGSRSKAALLRKALPSNVGRACMVGDRSMDVEAARDLGIDGIGVLYGYGELSEFSCAKTVVSSVQALTDLLLGGEKVARGPFVTLEGTDGCGKSTQAKLLLQWLRLCGHTVVATREPGGCPIAERVRQIVLDKGDEGMAMTDECEALLFAAARAQHVHDVIRPALERGDLVLCDRFVDSSVAYQGAARGLGVDYVRLLNQNAVGDCVPDKTILYEIDPEVAMARRAASDTLDRIEKSREALMRRASDAYREMARREPARFALVDASGEPEAILNRTKAIWRTV